MIVQRPHIPSFRFSHTINAFLAPKRPQLKKKRRRTIKFRLLLAQHCSFDVAALLRASAAHRAHAKSIVNQFYSHRNGNSIRTVVFMIIVFCVFAKAADTKTTPPTKGNDDGNKTTTTTTGRSDSVFLLFKFNRQPRNMGGK